MLLIRCLLVLPLSVVALCLVLAFAAQYLVSFLIFQSSWWGKESLVLYFNCLPCVSWPLVFWGSSSRRRELVCSVCNCAISSHYQLFFLFFFGFFFWVFFGKCTNMESWPRGYIFVSCSTQLSMKFTMFKDVKMPNKSNAYISKSI